MLCSQGAHSRKSGEILSGLPRKQPPPEERQQAEFGRSRLQNGTTSLSRLGSGTRAELLRSGCRCCPTSRAYRRMPLSASSRGVVFLRRRETASVAGSFSPSCGLFSARRKGAGWTSPCVHICRTHYACL